MHPVKNVWQIILIALILEMCIQVFVFTSWSSPFIFNSCSHWKANIYSHSEVKHMMIVSCRIKTDTTSTNVLYFPIIAKENVRSIFSSVCKSKANR